MISRLKLKILIYAVLALVFMSGLAIWHTYNLAKGRDYRRLADMKVLQSELTEYFRRFNTYKVAGCQIGSLVNFCGRASRGDFRVSRAIDPVNSNQFVYLVSAMSDDDFIISFALETGLGDLPRGAYVLTKNGVGQ